MPPVTTQRKASRKASRAGSSRPMNRRSQFRDPFCGPPSALRAAARLGKFVTHAPHGEDVFGVGSVFFDFGAQAVDMRIDGMLIAAVLVAPDFVEQLRARVDSSRVLCEVQE